MMAENHQRMSRRRGGPNNQPSSPCSTSPFDESAWRRRETSIRMYPKASSSITTTASMDLDSTPPSPKSSQRQLQVHSRQSPRSPEQRQGYSSRVPTSPVSPIQRQQPVNYTTSPMSAATESSSMPSNSRLPSGGSFWTKGKKVIYNIGRKGGSQTSYSNSIKTDKSGISKNGKTMVSPQQMKALAKLDQIKLEICPSSPAAETRVSEETERFGEYVNDSFIEDYPESLYTVYEDESIDTKTEQRLAIKDSWDFFRMVCSLLRDKRKYDEVFRKMQLDPVYPYLDSMMGLSDSVDDVSNGESAGANKYVSQVMKEQYYHMSSKAIIQDLVQQAEMALPSLAEICKALAASLGISEYAVGPVKEVGLAMSKAEVKYNGNVLKVTDFCRAMIIVDDIPTLLALLELATESFSPLIKRVKISTLQTYRASKPGGYRDCIINLELKDHVCEIAVHLKQMWDICGVDGFMHYRNSLEYSIDSFGYPINALVGLDHLTVSDLIKTAEEAVSGVPLETLEWHNEKVMLDYFCKSLLFMHHGLHELAECGFRSLVKLRCQNPEIGPDHPETAMLYQYLKQTLHEQKKTPEADVVAGWILNSEQNRRNTDVPISIWDQLILDPFESFNKLLIEPIEELIDPSLKERELAEKLQKEVSAGMNAWMKIREQRFKFLDGV